MGQNGDLTRARQMGNKMEINKNSQELYNYVCQIIDGTRSRIATTVNAEACLMNWNIGKRIKEDVLYNQRAEYGKEIVKTLADKLSEHYGKGWSYYKLQHCVRSAYTIDLDTFTVFDGNFR